jgi:hypothetical protein
MSKVEVDRETYQQMWERVFSECMHRYRGDRGEAYRLAMYYMKDWEIVNEQR